MSLLIPKEKIYLLGPEIFLPELVDNEELLKRFGYTDGLRTRVAWIEARTGIKKRPWVDKATACSDLAIAAGRKLLGKYHTRRDKIQQLILATVSGDHFSPPTSPLVQEGLGLENIGTYDLSAACAGFSTALLPATAQALATGADQLLICSEIRSKFLNPKDLSTAILFGDGAAACLLSKQADDASFLIRGVLQKTHGKYHSLITIPSGGSRIPAATETNPEKFYLHMGEGAGVFLSALQAMSMVGKSLISALDLSLKDVRWLVPHQANRLLIKEVSKELGFAAEQVVDGIEELGNISGASSPIALHLLKEKGLLKKGELVLNVSAGGGGFAAASLLEVL